MDETVRLKRQLRKAKRKLRNPPPLKATDRTLLMRYIKGVDLGVLEILERENIRIERQGYKQIGLAHRHG